MAADGGDKSKRRSDDFVARAHARGQQRQMHRAGSGIGPGAVLRSLKRRKLRFERRHFRAQNELAGFQRLRDCLVDFRF